MKSFGGFIAIIGIISAIISFLGRELVILGWIDTWGPTVGWVIRGALIVVGGALFFLAKAPAGEADG